MYEVPLFASKVSYRLRPSGCLAAAALCARFASSSFCAASHSSLRSMGLSAVPPETKPDDMLSVLHWQIALRSGLSCCAVVKAVASVQDDRLALNTGTPGVKLLNPTTHSLSQ